MRVLSALRCFWVSYDIQIMKERPIVLTMYRLNLHRLEGILHFPPEENHILEENSKSHKASASSLSYGNLSLA